MGIRLSIATGSGVAVLLACAAVPVACADDADNGIPDIPPSAQETHAPQPQESGSGIAQMEGGHAQAVGGDPSMMNNTQPSTHTMGSVRSTRVVRHCKRRRGVRTCRYFRSGRVIKVCKQRRHRRRHCHSYSRGAAAPGVRAAARINSGYAMSPLPSVVRIYWHAKSGYTNWCSGSILTRGLILTAGHCVYSNAHDGLPEWGYTGYYQPATYTIVPGNGSNGSGGATAPYGTWGVKNMWTTQAYTDNVLGADWAIIETNPHVDGTFPGDVAGTLSAYWSQQFPSGSELYSTGYPASGIFLQADYGGGNLQYFCDDQWNLDTLTDSSFGNYYGMNLLPCEENGGASGGPVFYHAGTSDWRIVGVNNRGRSASGGQYGANMLSFWLDSRFGSFWNEVVADVNAGQ
jgi:hypothetical protein